jgi:hypothetical protein
MRIKAPATVGLVALLLMALFAGPAVAQQEIPEDLEDLLVDGAPDEIPEGMELEEFIETYIVDEVEGDVIEEEPDVDEVEGDVIEEEEPEVQPAVREGPDVEVLGEVRERLPFTGGDLLGLSIIGLVLLALGYFAVRRGRAHPRVE